MDSFYNIIGIHSKEDRIRISKLLNLTTKELDYYNENHILPNESILDQIGRNLHICKNEIMLKMGIYNEELKELINKNLKFILEEPTTSKVVYEIPKLQFETQFGKLYHGDCLHLLRNTDSESFDLIFADPPFNLDKLYPSKINDNLKLTEYLKWTEEWLTECIRTLKTGGSLFLWNLPKWNTYFSTFLNQRLSFKHWIAVDIKYSLPINGRLYPSHYGLLYYVKGDKANVFKPDRLGMEICSKCFNEIKDYGGYKNKMNPAGINLSDVWYDIPPVRHSKYKGRKNANELSIKLLDRIIQMSSNKGDTVFDPFGGSGTSYIVAELKERKWIGIEIGPLEDIIKRFNRLPIERELLEKYRENYNCLFSEHIIRKRKERNIWTCDTFNQTPSKK